MLPDIRNIVAFGYIAGFTQLSFSWEQYVDEDKYGALVEW